MLLDDITLTAEDAAMSQKQLIIHHARGGML